MKKETEKLIKKLGKEFKYYDMSSKNFFPIENKEVDGIEYQVYSVLSTIIVFGERVGTENPPILRKSDGLGIGKSKEEAEENAIISAIQRLGIF